MKRKKTKSIVPFAIVLAAGALSAIVFAQGGKTTATATKSAPSAKPDETTVQITRAHREPLGYYTGGVRNDLFGAHPEPKPEPKPVLVPIDKPVVAAPVVVDPFVDFVFSGSASMNGEPVALIENKKTRAGTYVKIGEEFKPDPSASLGAKVTQINDRSITLDIAGKPRILAKNEDFKLVPLDKPAAFLTAQPATPNGVPGAPQPGMGGGMGPGGWQNMTPEQRAAMRQQFMQNMTPQQLDQMQQRRMNRQFGGGGGRRGGGGGFGGGGFGGGMGGG